VTQLWREEGEFAWKEYCKSRGFLDDEDFWVEKGKDWKWICKAKMNVFPSDVLKEGVGCAEGNYPRKWKFEGDWKDNKMNGIGYKKDFKTGGQYKGNWKDGKLEGHGIFIDKCGDKYDGNWVDGMKDGYGTYYWGEGRWLGHRYDGGWKKGKMHGQGKYSYPSGTYYEGEWNEDMMHGTGTYHFANGDIYEGDWADDKRYGYGVFKFAKHECRYEGQFKGVREGRGVLIWKNGDRYEGEWKMNSRVGRGTLYCADGRVYQQTWNETLGALYYNVEPPKFPPDQSSGTSILIESGEKVSSSSIPKDEAFNDELSPPVEAPLGSLSV